VLDVGTELINDIWIGFVLSGVKVNSLYRGDSHSADALYISVDLVVAERIILKQILRISVVRLQIGLIMLRAGWK
jgi:hypothetical protein